MTEKWRNRILYWALALVPCSGLLIIGQVFGSTWLVLYLLFYVFVYRPLVDTQRLISLNAIEEKDAWRFFIPFEVDTIRYFKRLWWG